MGVKFIGFNNMVRPSSDTTEISLIFLFESSCKISFTGSGNILQSDDFY